MNLVLTSFFVVENCRNQQDDAHNDSTTSHNCYKLQYPRFCFATIEAINKSVLLHTTLTKSRKTCSVHNDIVSTTNTSAHQI